ncbi:hypothetical protein O181_004900 [Austropuccinia psidii MF-1]|uniref:Uncharacterized protein n=1 Tax=Austropuccinia psidii MF-1 TaxID=1389203 RepID=A0A9Q3BHC6_9BASI|nr:hypothetical protein [Austropuccinia psidii MF-1]
MSTPSQPFFIGMINLCIQINSHITLNHDNSHLPSWIILWHNQHSLLLYLPNPLNPISSLPETLAKTLTPFLGAPQTFMHCGIGGAWFENCQSNPTQKLFVKGGFMNDAYEPSSSHKPKIALMIFTLYPKILFIIESFRKQDFNLQLPKGYDGHSHIQCRLFTPTAPTSILTPPHIQLSFTCLPRSN